jgi:hypothetical protein
MSGTWVGIGGMNSHDLIQAGTLTLVVLGRTRFEAWMQTLPQFAQTVPVAVAPGDSMTVSIDEQERGLGTFRSRTRRTAIATRPA